MPTTRRAATTVADNPTPEDDTTVQDETPMVGEVDVNALIRQLQEQAAAQQKHIENLLAEKGIPADPVAAQVLALQQHVSAQANANPWHSDSYTALKSYVDKLESDALTTNKAAKALSMVDSLREVHPGHELAYVRQLARDLHTMTLDPQDEDE